MREIVRVVGGLTLALVILLGAASSSLAAPKGPTGKTRKQCTSDLNDCRINNCSFLIDIDDQIEKCENDCLLDWLLCIPPRSDDEDFVADTLIRGQARTERALDRVVTKLTDLQTKVTAVQESLAGLQVNCSASDLLPLSPLPSRGSPGPEFLCQRNDQGQLFVRVHNQGGVSAEASMTRVVFACPNPSRRWVHRSRGIQPKHSGVERFHRCRTGAA